MIGRILTGLTVCMLFTTPGGWNTITAHTSVTFKPHALGTFQNQVKHLFISFFVLNVRLGQGWSPGGVRVWVGVRGIVALKIEMQLLVAWFRNVCGFKLHTGFG